MKRVLVIILCLVMVGTSVSIPKYAYADSTDGDIRINTSTDYCNLGDTIQIEVNDQDLNANSALLDSYAVTVSSTTQVGEQEQLLEEINVDLLETDANSGRFVGNVAVSAATGAAIGVKEILAQTSGKITAKYNDSGMWKYASITIEDAMLSGAVSEPDGAPATGGNIEVVMTVEGQAPEFIGAYPINPDGGTYQLPRLVAGSYSIRAYQPDATDHMGSQWLGINVDADGNCSDKDGVPFSASNFIFQEVLFSGTVIDKDSITLLDNEFHLELRSLNDKIGHDLRFDWESKNGVYRIAALNDGEYALRAVSQKEGNTDSCELYFKIENGIITDPGTSSPLASFDLQLTAPQVSGTVYYSGETLQPVANSGVVVFDSAMRYVYSKNT
ncbi:MAG: hypothetical protein H6Q59_1956, partial [Firmicutes bacterium]|nr:hypothetical protein [Bacillota bacterium]